jgi:hypothetical protein
MVARLEKRMNFGDAMVLFAAEEMTPRARHFATWNAADFAGRTALRVVTPQQFLRGH